MNDTQHIDEATRNAIQADMDGELGEEESLALETVLSESAEARHYRAGLRQAINLIEGMPQEDPPDDLGERIVAGARLPAQSASWREARRGGRQRGWRLWPVAAAFATGLLGTVAWYETLGRPDMAADSDRMVGTIAVRSAGQNQPVASQAIDMGDVSGTARLYLDAGRYRIDLNLESSDGRAIAVTQSDRHIDRRHEGEQP